MELNLDRLNRLALRDFEEEPPEKTPSKTLPEPFLRQGEYKTLSSKETATEGLTEGLGALQLKADQKKAEIDQSREVYRYYQDNTRKSEQLQTEILKGARAGEDIYSLFLKAVEAISCMTCNPPFASQIEEDIKSVYGRGLREEAPLKLELIQAGKRLDKLREAQQRETDPATLQRIATAIDAHKALMNDIAGLIMKAKQENPA